MRRFGVAILLAARAIPAEAEMAGPPAPVATNASPAEQAIALYKRAHAPDRIDPKCREPRKTDIVVCGGRSPYRLPLPDERGAAEGARRAVGDLADGAVGGSPVDIGPGVGLTLTVPLGKGAGGPAVKPTALADPDAP